jgi:Bacterial pre-peptidase C-terminal domain.
MKRLPDIAVNAVMVAFLCVIATVTNAFADGDLPEVPTGESAAVVESSQSDPEASAPEGVEDAEATAGSDAITLEEIIEPISTEADTPSSETGQEAEAEQIPVQESTIIAENGGDSEVETTVENPEPVIVVVDENGEALDLASQKSADAVASSDPWWIVAGVKYAVVADESDCPTGTTFGSTCWVNEDPITYALQQIDGGLVPTDGKLYVLAGNYEEDVMIDGTSGSGNLGKLKGLIGAGSGLVTLTGSITIRNTTLGFTLSGFTIDGSVMLSNNSGALVLDDLYIQNGSGDGLTVSGQNGSVKMTSVQSRGNLGDGARIDNCAAASGSVAITNSSFDYNDDGEALTWNVGLYVNTNGAVTLEGVTASNNNGNGAEIYGFSSLSIKNSLFDHNSVAPYSNEYGYGLIASTSKIAAVGMQNVFAYYNDNTAIDITTPGAVTLNYVRASHSSIRTGNIASGETVNERLNEDNKFSGDRWYFNGTNAQELEILLESGIFDAYLELWDAATNTLLASNDNIDGTTTNSKINFTLEADGVYYIIVKTLESSSALDGDYQLSLNDSLHTNKTVYAIPGIVIDTTSGAGIITINSGMFQDNSGNGLEIESLKNVILNTVDASYNSQNGAVLDTCQYDAVRGICRGLGTITLNSPPQPAGMGQITFWATAPTAW